MKTSARNEFTTKIVDIKSGGVMSEIVLELSSGITLVATITNSSKDALALEVGKEVLALIKSSHIVLSKNNLATSARNNIKCSVSAVKTGAVNSEIELSLGDLRLYSVITNESTRELDIKNGDEIYLICKSTNVILALKD